MRTGGPINSFKCLPIAGLMQRGSVTVSLTRRVPIVASLFCVLMLERSGRATFWADCVIGAYFLAATRSSKVRSVNRSQRDWILIFYSMFSQFYTLRCLGSELGDCVLGTIVKPRQDAARVPDPPVLCPTGKGTEKLKVFRG